MTAAPPRLVIEAGGGSDESITAPCHAPWSQIADANDCNRCKAVAEVRQNIHSGGRANPS